MFGFLLGLVGFLPFSNGAEAQCPANGQGMISSSSSMLQASRTTFHDTVDRGEGLDVLMLGVPAKDDVGGSSVPLRPYLVKTFKCSNSQLNSCEECYGGDNCFKQQTEDGAEYLVIHSINESETKFHHARVVFDCPSPSSKFSVEAEVLVRATRVNVTVNNITARPQTEPESDSSDVKRIKFAVDNLSTELNIVEFDLSFQLSNGYSFAKVERMKLRTTEDYIVCEDHKACLIDLETSGEGGKRLRNDNAAQLRCLMTTDFVSDACSNWKSCLNPAHTTERLIMLLKAAGVTSSPTSLAQEAQNATQKDMSLLQDPGACIYPTIEDPESWLCTYMDAMEQACQSVDGVDTVTCLTGLMCEDTCHQVCPSWKAAAGCDNPTLMQVRKAIHASPKLGLLSRAQSSQRGRLTQGNLDSVAGVKLTDTC